MLQVTIKADELAALKASDPTLGLNGLVDITFDFNEHGEICNCHGTIAEKASNPVVSDQLRGPGWSALINLAERRFLKHLRNLNHQPSGTAVVLPFMKRSAREKA